MNQTSTVTAQVVDLRVQNEGSIYLLHPRTPRGQAWIDINLPEDRQSWGDSIAVEHRHILAIVQGAIRDGLEVRS